MNITPALPNPYQPPVDQDRASVVAVRAANRVRDAADQREQRNQPLQPLDRSQRDRLAAGMQVPLARHQGGSLLVNRALASYAEVADSGERSGLRDLLGFDAYA